MTLGSLFSGSGGFELAGVLNGISPVWASEIEPYPIAVTTSRFPWMKHLGNVAKINGAKIEPVDVITFGSPCFPAGVLILTDRGFLPIEEVTVGMKVLSHTGAWRTVTAVGSKLAETILLKGNHYGLETTPNHPIYSAELDQDGKNLQRMGEWTAAEDMDGKYWAVPNEVQRIPIPPVLYEAREKKDRFVLNEDSFYLIGRWLGDGWLRDTQRPGRPPGQKWGVILICESYDKAEEQIAAVKRVVPHFGIERAKTCVKVKIYSKPLSRWLDANFGRYAYGKTLPGWVYGMSENFRKALFLGQMDSDGYHMKDEAYKLTTVSKKLAHSVRVQAETLGYATTIYFDRRPSRTTIENRIVNQRDTYSVVIRKQGRDIRACGHSWYPVQKVQPTGEMKRVYNLTVEQDNSYIADGVVVHNCQDLSVAGKQAGIHEGQRSSLFFQAIRIINEMRCATNGKYPRFAVFENVPGLFSTGKGEDFRAVLQAFVGLCNDTLLVPEPPKGKWLHAGEIVGDHFSVAWRVQGAEYWGVPQRRNRVYLVADLAGQRAGEILFEQEGLRRDSAQGGTAREGSAADVEGGFGGSAGFLSGQGVKAHGIGYEIERTPTLRSQAGGNSVPCVLRTLPLQVSESKDYPVYMLQGNCIDREVKCNGCGWKKDISFTLNTVDRHGVCYQNTVGALCAADWRGPNSQYVGSDKQVVDPVCHDARGNGDGKACSTITGDHERRVTDYTNVVTYGGDKAGTLDASYYKGAGTRNGKEREFIAEMKPGRKYVVRRLTPTECARLQGFPDCWAIPVHKDYFTRAEIEFWENVRREIAEMNGKQYRPYGKREQLQHWYNRLRTDSAEYKLYGNGIALPCAAFVLRGIAAVLRREEALCE